MDLEKADGFHVKGAKRAEADRFEKDWLENVSCGRNNMSSDWRTALSYCSDNFKASK